MISKAHLTLFKSFVRLLIASSLHIVSRLDVFISISGLSDYDIHSSQQLGVSTMSDHLAFADTNTTFISFCSSECCLYLVQRDTNADANFLLHAQQDLGTCWECGAGDDDLRCFPNELGVRVAVEAGKATGVDEEVTHTAWKDVEGSMVTARDGKGRVLAVEGDEEEAFGTVE